MLNGSFPNLMQKNVYSICRFTSCCLYNSLSIYGGTAFSLTPARVTFDKKLSYHGLNKPFFGQIQPKVYIHNDKRTSTKVEAISSRLLTVPNMLCLFRIGSTPIISYLILTNQMHLCLYLSATAAFTDLLDGWIAKTFPSQQSAFGSFLDPVADKIFVSVLSISLAYVQLIPVWLVALFVFRDLALLAGGAIIRYKSISRPRSLSKYFDAEEFNIKVEPLLISKINTFLQLGLIAVSIGAPIWDYTNSIYLQFLWYTTAITTVSSGFGYLFSKETFQKSNRP